MMKITLALAAASLALFNSGNASAAVVATSIRINNSGAGGSGQSFLQIGELQAFSGGINVALGATASASSVYSDVYGGPSTDAGKANDGLTDGQYYGDGIYHSLDSSVAEFLDLTFATAQSIDSLSIFGRTDNCCTLRDSYTFTLFNGADIVRTGTLDARATSFATASFSSAVPEPATWAMMVIGFGAIGGSVRRRKAKATIAYA